MPEHNTLTGANLHEPKGVAAATIRQVYQADGAGSGTWEAILTDMVIVNAAGDFPTPSAGEIQLADNTTYIIDGIVTITDTLLAGTNSAVVSFSHDPNELNYTGTGSMLKGREDGMHVSHLSLRCANGTLLDFEDTTPVESSVIEFTDVTIIECKHCGNCKNIKQHRYFSCVFQDISTTGHTYTGNLGQIFAGDTDFVNNSLTPLYNLGSATADLIWVVDYQADITNASGSFLSGLTASGNINAGGLGSVLIGLLTGPGTDLVNISPDDDLWEFDNNSRIRSTRSDGLLSLSANVTATTIASAGVGVLAAGTWVVERGSQFTGTTAGRLTYTGIKDIVVPVTARVSVEPVSGTNKNVGAIIAKNGTTIANSKATINTDISVPLNVSAVWQLTLSTNDYIEVFLVNDTDTIDVLGSSAVLRLN